MADDFINPLNDPRFPNRPQHPDFWRLSESILALDALATEGNLADAEIQANAFADVDLGSLMYLASNYVAKCVQQGLPIDQTALEVGFVTGVLVGIRYQKAGGHR